MNIPTTYSTWQMVLSIKKIIASLECTWNSQHKKYD